MPITVARVFPTHTSASPDDNFAFFGPPPKEPPEVDEVHISTVFTWDLPKAEQLARQWRDIAPVKVGGPAYGEPDGEFTPGLYTKKGITITSRGCPNHCWFCGVWKRYGGKITEYPIAPGYKVFDDNLLACSETHIRAVFSMLKQQEKHPVFSGGLEAKLLRPWHCDLLHEVKVSRMYFAYDTADDYEPLVCAGRMLRAAGISAASHRALCYVLIGYPGDTFDHAEKRLADTCKAGFFPYAMLYRNFKGDKDKTWGRFQRVWCRPEIVATTMKKLLTSGVKL